MRLNRTKSVEEEMQPLPQDNLTGKAVYDNAGRYVGHVGRLRETDSRPRVRLLEIFCVFDTGSVLRSLVPVDVVTCVSANYVILSVSAQTVRHSPPLDGDELNADSIDELQMHYSALPFWTSAYGYPTVPFFM